MISKGTTLSKGIIKIKEIYSQRKKKL